MTTKFSLEKFTEFLKGIDLEKYRNQYSKIKIVEMDLPKNIQALKTIYEQYWQNANNRETPLSFDEYYDDIYFKANEEYINPFWETTGFGLNCDCFIKGLRARIYRTWASLITQIHGGYVAESVFGPNTVKMGMELDYKNIDILVTKSDRQEIKIQIKKETHRPEIARMRNTASKDGVVDIYYIVPSKKDYENPYYIAKKRKGELRDSLKEFIEFNNKGTLDRLDNGFVIFTPQAFLEIKQAN